MSVVTRGNRGDVCRRRRHMRRAVRRRLGPLLGHLRSEKLLDPLRNVVSSAPSGARRPELAVPTSEMMFNRFAGQFGHGDPTTLCFVPQLGVHFIWKLYGSPFHVCQHTLGEPR